MTDAATFVDPENFKEWQEAVDLAYALLALESARQYGLVSGGPEVNIARCEDILTRGAALGYTPADDAVERLTRAMA